MARARVLRGTATQADEPEWRPLLDAVGEEVCGDFMWMFEVELSNGTRLHAYKHADTRRYVHLDHTCAAFVFESPDRYRRLPLREVLAAAFTPLPGLAGVTDEQISASWAAVGRLARD